MKELKHKIISVVVAIVLILVIIAIAFGVNAKMKEAVAISVIGGADGPTSIFLAGKIGDGVWMGAVAAGILLVVIGVAVYWKIRKK